jgi:hypothetical protein
MVKIGSNFKTSSVEKEIYFLSFIPGNNSDLDTVISAINLQTKEKSEIFINGLINNLIPLDNKNLLISGNIGEDKGIFMYNMENHSYQKLASGNILNFDMAPDGSKIAYSMQNVNLLNL